MYQKQVDEQHYCFPKYIHKRRWMSLWHQVDEILAIQPERVLEIGPGPGLFKVVASAFGIKVETLDLDPDLNPDHLGSATDLPFVDDAYEVVCAFQVLEHLPFEDSLEAFREMTRVARDKVIISLPDAKIVWPQTLYIPKLGYRNFMISKPQLGLQKHQFNGEHYWEINKLGYKLDRVIEALELAGNTKLEKTYRVNEYPYHRFLVFYIAT